MSVPAARTSSSPLGFLERLYLVEVLKGMVITAAHVLRNLVVQLKARPEERFRTIEYPDMRKPMAERYKGAHRLTTRPDGQVKCVACMCCPTVCPAHCITIVPEETGPGVEKRPAVFEIDELRCVVCGLCVEACPCDAIRMDSGTHAKPVERRGDLARGRGDDGIAVGRGVHRFDGPGQPVVAGLGHQQARPLVEDGVGGDDIVAAGVGRAGRG